MFAPRYFPVRYFPPRYFPPSGVVVVPAETFPDLSNLQGRVNVAAGATGQVLPRDETGALLYSNQMQKFQTSLEIQTGDPCACTVLYHLVKRIDDR